MSDAAAALRSCAVRATTTAPEGGRGEAGEARLSSHIEGLADDVDATDAGVVRALPGGDCK